MSRDITEITGAIVNGDFDDDFDAIAGAIKIRRDALNSAKALAFKVGDTVRFNAQASPKYIRGATAVVTEIGRGKKVMVELAEDYGRFPAGETVGAPVAIIDLVESA